MAFVIKDNKLVKAKRITKLTKKQKNVLRVITRKQVNKLDEIKKRIAEESQAIASI